MYVQPKYEDILYISRKTLGYVIEPNLLCSLIFSILDKERIDNKLTGLVIEIFTVFIGENYPNVAIDFLKGIKPSEINVEIKNNASKIIIRNIEKYQSKISSLPRLKELFPPKQQSYQIALEQRKNMKKGQ